MAEAKKTQKPKKSPKPKVSKGKAKKPKDQAVRDAKKAVPSKSADTQIQEKKITASYKNAPISPQKARLVADLVRGKGVQEALDILTVTKKKGAKILKKVILSAVANAEQVQNLEKESLTITRILVDDGIKFRRYRFVSRGRAHGYVKRRCHILVELAQVA